MSYDLTGIPIDGVEPAAVQFGGILTPPLGGPSQKVDRPGSRSALSFTTPLMSYEPEGRRWSARLRRAQREGALIEIPQPGLVIGNPGAPKVATNIAAGRLVGLSGLTAGYTVREGQWISIIVAGQRYADQVEADATATGGGTVTVTLSNLLRVSLAGGETVEIAAPKIEGWLTGDLSWPIDINRDAHFTFVVMEAA